MYRAKFSRFSLDSVWQLNTTAVHTTEAQRHALGLGTCSGCHASETNNAAGFQILPAVQGTEAARSSYLRDVATFTHAGATYRYTPLADRRATMQHFLAGDPPLALCPAGVAACQAADQLTLPSPPLGK
jgi:mono/diheme cytochrome c family protein